MAVNFIHNKNQSTFKTFWQTKLITQLREKTLTSMGYNDRRVLQQEIRDPKLNQNYFEK